MNQINIWAYTQREIKDLKPEFEEKFDTQLTRDYENVWEWIWNGPKEERRINVSREHNWQTGEHDKPLRIMLTWDAGGIDKTKIMASLLSILKTDLYLGEIKNSGREKVDYVIAEIVKYDS